jgi:hypothetical protein
MTQICLTRNETIGFLRLGGAGQGRAGPARRRACLGTLPSVQRCVSHDMLAQEFLSAGVPMSVLAGH